MFSVSGIFILLVETSKFLSQCWLWMFLQGATHLLIFQLMVEQFWSWKLCYHHYCNKYNNLGVSGVVILPVETSKLLIQCWLWVFISVANHLWIFHLLVNQFGIWKFHFHHNCKDYLNLGVSVVFILLVETSKLLSQCWLWVFMSVANHLWIFQHLVNQFWSWKLR